MNWSIKSNTEDIMFEEKYNDILEMNYLIGGQGIS